MQSTAENIITSPILNERLLRTSRFPFVIVSSTPKNAIITANIRLIPKYSPNTNAAIIEVIIGVVAINSAEFIAVIYSSDMKNNAWYPNIPSNPAKITRYASLLFNFRFFRSVFKTKGNIITDAIKNLKNVNSSQESSKIPIFPVINAPAPKETAGIINRNNSYFFKSFFIHDTAKIIHNGTTSYSILYNLYDIM